MLADFGVLIFLRLFFTLKGALCIAKSFVFLEGACFFDDEGYGNCFSLKKCDY